MTDTLRIDPTMHGFGRAPKRIKTEQPRAGNNSPPNFANPYGMGGEAHAPIHFQGPHNGIPRPAESSFNHANPFSGNGHVPPPLHLPLHNGHVPASQNSPTVTGGIMPAGVSQISAGARDLSRSEPNFHHSPLAPNPARPDISTAPRDPHEVISWLLRQVQQMPSNMDHGQGMDLNHSGSTPNTPPGLTTPGQATYHGADAQAEKERLRSENRVRKQRWRQDNQERNKDNDLRCRVNKLAKQRFGSDDSHDKRRFIEEEFQTRRLKREQKQRNRAQQSGTLPAFSSAGGIPHDFNSQLHAGATPGADKVANAIVNVLHAIGNQQSPSRESIDAANHFRTLLDSGSFSPDALHEGIRMVQASNSAHRNMHSGRYEANPSEDRGSTSGDDESFSQANLQAHTPSQIPGGRHILTPFDPTGAPQRSDFQLPYGSIPGPSHASAPFLSGLTQDKSYDSPYGKPKAPEPPPVSVTTDEGKCKEPLREERLPSPSPVLLREVTSEAPKSKDPTSQSNIDALLVLANGGSLSDDDDDDDDKTIDDPTGLNERAKHTTVRDSNTEGVTTRLRAGKKRKASAMESRHDADIQSLYAGSDFAVNTIVPVAKAQAVSRNTKVHQDGPASNGKEPLHRLSNRVNGLRKRRRNQDKEEEQRKVRLYGYPGFPKPRVNAQ